MEWYISKHEKRRRLLAKIVAFMVMVVTTSTSMFGPAFAYRLANEIPLIGHRLQYENWVIIAGATIGGSLGSWLAYRVLVSIGGYTDHQIREMWFGKHS